MKQFVKDFALIYGLDFVGYNIHSLIHLAQDVRKFGPLDSISCFPLETFLGGIYLDSGSRLGKGSGKGGNCVENTLKAKIY